MLNLKRIKVKKYLHKFSSMRKSALDTRLAVSVAVGVLGAGITSLFMNTSSFKKGKKKEKSTLWNLLKEYESFIAEIEPPKSLDAKTLRVYSSSKSFIAKSVADMKSFMRDKYKSSGWFLKYDSDDMIKLCQNASNGIEKYMDQLEEHLKEKNVDLSKIDNSSSDDMKAILALYTFYQSFKDLNDNIIMSMGGK